MKKPRGFVIHEGPSLIDGKPIVLIATYGTRNKENRKTGALLQTYILRSDVSPVEATKSGDDVSICGDCVHRKQNTGSCYVRVEQGPLIVWKAYKRGIYPRLTLRQSAELVKGEKVRLGTYGDPAAIPLGTWDLLLTWVKGCTGYTHQWKTADIGLSQYCMASCDTNQETTEARAKGWRTFTVIPTVEITYSHESAKRGAFLCPASEQAGKKLTCSECMACGGHSSPNTASVFIPVHGVAFKQTRFNNLITIGRS